MFSISLCCSVDLFSNVSSQFEHVVLFFCYCFQFLSLSFFSFHFSFSLVPVNIGKLYKSIKKLYYYFRNCRNKTINIESIAYHQKIRVQAAVWAVPHIQSKTSKRKNLNELFQFCQLHHEGCKINVSLLWPNH